MGFFSPVFLRVEVKAVIRVVGGSSFLYYLPAVGGTIFPSCAIFSSSLKY